MRRVLTRNPNGRGQVLQVVSRAEPIALETEAACILCSISEYTLRKWAREGRVTPRDCGNKKLWLYSELRACVEGLDPWYKRDDQQNQEEYSP